MPGGLSRTIRNWKDVPREINTDIDTLYRFLKQQSITIEQVIQTQTGSVVRPVEVANPQSNDTPQIPGSTVDDPSNPSDPDGPAPQPTGTPTAVTYTAASPGLVPATGSTTNACHLLLPESITIESAAITWSDGESDFLGSSSNHYQITLMSFKRNRPVDQGSLRSNYFPIYAFGSQQFPGLYENADLDAGDKLYIRIVPVGTPSAIGSRKWTLTVTGVTRIPQL